MLRALYALWLRWQPHLMDMDIALLHRQRQRVADDLDEFQRQRAALLLQMMELDT